MITNKKQRRPVDDAWKANMSKSWNYDKHVTPEITKKRSESIKLKWKDPIYRAKRMAWLTKNPPNKGKKFSLEHCKNISEGKKGKPRRGVSHNNITKAKLRLAAIKQFEDPKMREIIRQKRLLQIFPIKDSKPERMLQIALNLQQVEFRKHEPILGQPDIFIEPNICVFVDGDYWHANPEKYLGNMIIKKNQEMKASDIWAYDISIQHELNRLGYNVIRIWESEIKKDANICALKIINLIKSLRYEPLL